MTLHAFVHLPIEHTPSPTISNYTCAGLICASRLELLAARTSKPTASIEKYVSFIGLGRSFMCNSQVQVFLSDAKGRIRPSQNPL